MVTGDRRISQPVATNSVTFTSTGRSETQGQGSREASCLTSRGRDLITTKASKKHACNPFHLTNEKTRPETVDSPEVPQLICGRGKTRLQGLCPLKRQPLHRGGLHMGRLKNPMLNLVYFHLKQGLIRSCFRCNRLERNQFTTRPPSGTDWEERPHFSCKYDGLGRLPAAW